MPAFASRLRRLHFRDLLSFSEIARRTGLSRNTVKQWIKAPGGSVPRDGANQLGQGAQRRTGQQRPPNGRQ